MLASCSLPLFVSCRQGGDVKLAVCIYVAGWIADRSDFDTTWAGCVPESSDAGGCRECRGAGQLLYLQDSCAAMRPKLAVGQCMRAWSTVLPLPSNLPVLLPCPPADSFTLVWETKVLLHLNSALGKLLTMQAAGQSLQLATHSFFYAGAGGLWEACVPGVCCARLSPHCWRLHAMLRAEHGDLPFWPPVPCNLSNCRPGWTSCCRPGGGAGAHRAAGHRKRAAHQQCLGCGQ